MVSYRFLKDNSNPFEYVALPPMASHASQKYHHLKIGIPFRGSVAALSAEVYNCYINSGTITIRVVNHGASQNQWNSWPEKETVPSLQLNNNTSRANELFTCYEYPFKAAASLRIEALTTQDFSWQSQDSQSDYGGTNVTLWGRIRG